MLNHQCRITGTGAPLTGFLTMLSSEGQGTRSADEVIYLAQMILIQFQRILEQGHLVTLRSRIAHDDIVIHTDRQPLNAQRIETTSLRSGDISFTFACHDQRVVFDTNDRLVSRGICDSHAASSGSGQFNRFTGSQQTIEVLIPGDRLLLERRDSEGLRIAYFRVLLVTLLISGDLGSTDGLSNQFRTIYDLNHCRVAGRIGDKSAILGGSNHIDCCVRILLAFIHREAGCYQSLIPCDGLNTLGRLGVNRDGLGISVITVADDDIAAEVAY